MCKTRDGRVMTLEELFRSMNLTAYDLTVDMLDVHAVSDVNVVRADVCACALYCYNLTTY